LEKPESGVGNFGKSESEILERSESDILPPTPQPWSQLKETIALMKLKYGVNPNESGVQLDPFFVF